ncbi:MAG: hypothetical protein GY855_02840, partial [candidate division Zixibacteria bacterium]|nr:hypothetical protein [candidate division Zixibacteria bacterium]
NIMGEKIQTLVNSYSQPGDYSITWDASGFSSGIYFYKLTTIDESNAKRMTLLK